MITKRHVDDATQPWEERYRRLEAHHIEETSELYAEIKRLRKLARTPVSQALDAAIVITAFIFVLAAIFF